MALSELAIPSRNPVVTEVAWVGSTRAERGPALIHAVALVYESLIVAVYPDNPDSRKLEIDDGVDGQSQRCGEDQSV